MPKIVRHCARSLRRWRRRNAPQIEGKATDVDDTDGALRSLGG
jgi:hypothetical protein